MTKAVRSQRLNYAEDTGSVNALSVAYDPPLTAYTLGLILHVKVLASNTGPSTINAGAGVVAIKKPNGSALAALDLPGGSIAGLVYDGTAFQMLNFGGAGGGPGSVFNVKVPYCVDTSTTPGIITAPFSPAIITLVPGDIVAVKLANTIPGATVINVNAIGAKTIKANGGTSAADLLQGDGVAGDILLLMYDGTFFWMTPDPALTASITLSVPSQFANVPTALAAIRRKVIASTATVTVQLASGQYPPFSVNHPNADRIVIKGTMLTSAPISTNFAQTGSSLGARVADSANNIAMLRTRYGTEIVVPAGQVGFENLGPGMPLLQDVLITGPNFSGSQAVGVKADLVRIVASTNVACWGLDTGWLGGGSHRANNCSACGCWGYGFQITGPGGMGAGNCFSVGNGIGGFNVNQNGCLLSNACIANFNGSIGAGAGDNSQMSWYLSIASGNGAVDITASVVSEVIVTGGVHGTFSPDAGVLGNFGAIIIFIP